MKSLGPAQVDPLQIFSMAHAVFEKLPTGWLEQNTGMTNSVILRIVFKPFLLDPH